MTAPIRLWRSLRCALNAGASTAIPPIAASMPNRSRVQCVAPGSRLIFRRSVAPWSKVEIIALKGLGGYQLVCDACNETAVNELRVRKRRSRKPFAIMVRDIAALEEHCFLTETEKQVLLSPAAPIVLLRMRENDRLAPGIAPGLRHLGAMVPYTPLHHLLFGGSLRCLVMTSGNVSEEPIVTQNQAAFQKLSPLADLVVGHNRDIFMRVDDSVTRLFEGTPRLLRRARGYAPEAISLGREVGEVLAVGAELKNTFCLTKGSFAILSQHIGDLENYETLQFFEETLHNLQSVYQSRPRVIAHDLHPDALSTRWAQARPEPKIAVQHHHAHIASCMAENGLDGQVIGVAFDGTGWGADGQDLGRRVPGVRLCEVHALGASSVRCTAGRRSGYPAALAHGGSTSI